MTQAVPTDGFSLPPGAPPADPKPGFVSQVPPAAPAAPAPATPAAPQPDLTAAIAALSAAIAPAPAATPAPTFDVGDDPLMQSMAAVVRTAAKGIDLDRLLGKALSHGDASLIDTAYLQEKGGEQAAELLTIAKGMVEAVNAKALAVEAEAHALAGSEQNWQACTAAFNTKAPAELRGVIIQMLDSGNSAQVKAAAKLVVDFAKGSGFVPTPGALLQTGGAAPAAAQSLSKDEFQAELRKLNPNDRNFAQARNDLYARRVVGKQLGR